MATYTPNINLKKPNTAENFSTADINANSDKIDTAIGLKAPQASTYTKTEVDAKDALKAEKVQEAWIAPTLLNSWVNFGVGFNDAGYFKDQFGIVHLKGLIKSGTLGQPAFLLPVGYRIVGNNYMLCLSNGAAGQLTITADGNVKPASGNNAWFSLEGITFKAA